MAITNAQIAVDDDPVVALNTQDDSAGMRLYIKNMTAEAAYLGKSDVASGDGYELLDNEQITVVLKPGEILYAISTVTGTTLSVLRS